MYNPHTHLEFTRARHADLLREARNRELARRLSEGRPGLAVRLWARLAWGRATRPEPRAV
jgi:hypothetical protein